MAGKYNIAYKTFDSLMADVQDDLNMLDAERYIMPDKYYKDIERCNEKLSTKINPIREDVLTVKAGRTKLPDDFKLLERLYVCLDYYDIDTTINFNVEVKSPTRYCYNDILSSCNQISVIDDPKGLLSFSVRKRQTGTWLNISKINLAYVEDTPYCSKKCSNNYASKFKVKIIKEKDDYYLESNFDGEVYLVYLAKMISEDGDLIMLDHPAVQEYYEYSVKLKIYELAWLNGIEEYRNQIEYLREKLRVATMDAIRFIKMVDFAELKQVYFDNRKRYYLKYDKIIQE